MAYGDFTNNLLGRIQPKERQNIPATPTYPANTSAQDFYDLITQAVEKPRPAGKGAAATMLRNLRGASTYTLPTGFANLAEIIASQGRTDPMRLNQQLVDISRSTGATQQAVEGQMARSGLGGSGLAPALTAAVGAGGARQRSEAIAEENRMTEERRRQDLMLLYNLLINPSLQAYGIELGADAQQLFANRQLAGSIIQGGASAASAGLSGR